MFHSNMNIISSQGMIMNVISILEISKADKVNQFLTHSLDPHIKDVVEIHFITKLSPNIILLQDNNHCHKRLIFSKFYI